VTAPELADRIRPNRLDRYEARTDRPLLVLAVCFLVVYTVQITVPGLSPAARRCVESASWLIWGLFAADLAIRVWLAEHRGRYLLSHPADVLFVVLPALRPLRVLRIFTAGQALVTRSGRLSLLRTTQAIAAAASLLVLIAALAALDAERDAPGTHMATLADSLWWAATTVTTVGYGDTFPVTGTGRIVAVALMLVGISLVGLITATVAAWFIAQTRDAAVSHEVDITARLARLEATLSEIHAAVIGATKPPIPDRPTRHPASNAPGKRSRRPS
jgi:voltage-gated potassium channel